MGKEKGYVCSNLKGSVEINESRIPVAKDKGIPGDEKQEQEKARFKTGANSASPNANSREKGSTPSGEIKKETMLQKGDSEGHNAERRIASNFRIGRVENNLFN